MRTIGMVALSLTVQAGLGSGAVLASPAPASAPTYEVNSDSSIRLVPDSWLRRGAPIRVHRSDGSTIIGTFEGTAGESLQLHAPSDRSAAVPLGAIRSLELGREQAPRTWSGFSIGLLAGAVAGAGLGALASEKGDKDAGAIVMGMLFAPIGSLIGSLIGASDHSTVWVPTRVPAPESSIGSGAERPGSEAGAGRTGGDQ